MPEKIRYRDGYKYQLVDPYWIQTDIMGKEYSVDNFIVLRSDGALHIASGYAWNGASGPTLDSKSSMRASLVHDALYQLMSEFNELLVWRGYADSLLANICQEDGMSEFRAYLWQKGVNWFGESSAKEKSKVLEAP